MERSFAPGEKSRGGAARRALGTAGGLIGSLVASALAGIAYEAVASRHDDRRYPRRGRMVDVGGHRLHLDCLGQGSPTVVLEGGVNEYSAVWRHIQPEVAKHTLVCSYDRAGYGWSDSGSKPRSPEMIAKELHVLLRNAEIPGPYVLVGHSLGGRYARVYASRFPDEVAGLVLVDAYQEGYDSRISPADLEAFNQKRAQAYQGLGLLGRLGVARLFGAKLLTLLDPDYARVSPELRTEFAIFTSRPRAVEAAVAELAAGGEANEMLRAHGGLGHRPLIVLTHGRPWPGESQERAWQESQREIAGLSSRGSLVVASNSGHSIQAAEPDLVIDAIRQVVEMARDPQH